MGYLIDIKDQEFRIEAEDTEDAFEKALALMNDPSAERAGYSLYGDTRHFSWLNNAEPDEWESLGDAMDDWRFPVFYDEHGNVKSIDFTGQKIGQEDQLFERIAPYVKDGSYVEMIGEDGQVYRYVFDGETVEKVYMEHDGDWEFY